MRAALPALVLLAAGCPGPPGADPFGTFAVAIDDVPTDDVVVTSLEVSVGEVVLEAEGPSGPESVAVLVDHLFEPLIAVDAVGFDLERGPHTGVWIEVVVRADDGPGLRFDATTAAAGADGTGTEETGTEETGTEDTGTEETSTEDTGTEETSTEETPEAGKISIAVDEITLGFEVPRIVIGDEALIGRVRFDPQGWLDRLDLEDGGVVIGPDSPRYDALLQAIEATTVFTFDSGPGRDDDEQELE